MVSVEVCPTTMAFGAKALLMVGAATTVRFAVLLAVPGVGVVCVVVTPEVVLGRTPGLLLVTLKMTVQLPLAGIVIPLKLNDVAFAARELGVVPTQVPVTAPPDAAILVSVSVNEAPVSAVPLVLLSVRVTVEVPPAGIDVGLNVFEMVGVA